MYMYMYMSSYIGVKSPKQTQKNNILKVNIAEKKLSKLNIFNPTPPLAKMIKCMRSDAMKYESDYEFTDKVLNKSSLITTQNKISTFMQKTNSP